MDTGAFTTVGALALLVAIVLAYGFYLEIRRAIWRRLWGRHDRPPRPGEVIPVAAMAVALLLGWAYVGAGAWHAMVEERDWVQGGAALILFLIGAAVFLAIVRAHWRRHGNPPANSRLSEPDRGKRVGAP